MKLIRAIKKVSLCILLLNFCNVSVTAQERRMLLIIDTFTIEEKIKNPTEKHHKYSSLIIRVNEKRQNYPLLVDDSTCYIEAETLYCRLLLKNDTDKIRIGLDHKGGFLQLNKAYHFRSDTIRINKHIVLNRNYPDTNKTSKCYWRILNDTLKFAHCKSKYEVEKGSENYDKPLHVNYIINGTLYSSQTEWRKSNFTSLRSSNGTQKRFLKRYRTKSRTTSRNTFNVIEISL